MVCSPICPVFLVPVSVLVTVHGFTAVQAPDEPDNQ